MTSIMESSASLKKRAGFWLRFLSHFIDSMLLTVAASLLSAVILIAFRASLAPTDLQLFTLGAYFVVAFPYYVWGHFRFGSTLGKWLLGVEVVDALNGRQITLKQSVLRFFGYFLSSLTLMVGYVMAGIHPRKQALHELISSTVSVRTRPCRRHS